MKDYSKYILSTGTQYISNSGSDERGQYTNGAAGDQTGKEWQLKAWYSRPWTVVLRYEKDPRVGELMANLSCAAALNDNIGYDQLQRSTYWTQLKKVNYDPSAITVKCEEDCTAGVTANTKACGYLLGIQALQELGLDTYSSNMRARFVKAGFTALTGSKYCSSTANLLPGDVLLYESHHAAANVTVGSNMRSTYKSGNIKVEPLYDTLGSRELKKGMVGNDVKQMQTYLIKLGFSCGVDGADGDFGSNTFNAVKNFQKANDLGSDGIMTNKCIKALIRCIDAYGKTKLTATGSVFVRSQPNKESDKLGSLQPKEELPFTGKISEDGWYSVKYKDTDAWVSGKYSKIS